MFRRRSVCAVLFVVFAAPVFAEDSFTRVVREKGEIVALEVPSISMSMKVGDKTVKVVLYGEVHIADKVHYIRRNVQFEQHDKVFYELVADTPGQRPEKQEGMYQIFSFLLELDNQMAQVDYTPTNLIHADMTKDQLQSEMRKNGDTPITLVLEAVLASMRKQNKVVFALEDKIKSGEITRDQAIAQLQGAPGGLGNQADLFALLTDPNRGVKLKRMMAASFESSGDIKDALGPVIGGYLIDKRNAKCIETFQQHMASDLKEGGGTNYAIYYGAAHLGDLKKRLETLGFKEVSTRWQRAWGNLTLKKGGQKDPLIQLLEQFQKLQQDQE